MGVGHPTSRPFVHCSLVPQSRWQLSGPYQSSSKHLISPRLAKILAIAA